MTKSTKPNPLKDPWSNKKILLVLLPYWIPLIPPLGMACLKGYLQQHGYEVKAVDANTEVEFREIYGKYFTTLKEQIPADKMGNFYNIGHDLIPNHLMAYFNRNNETDYIDLVEELIYKNYFCKIDRQVIDRLDQFIGQFYSFLEDYFLRLLEREKPALVGASVYRGTLAPSMFALKLMREKCPSIKNVMGGGIFSQELVTGSENLRYFLENTPYVDNIIIGEGELLFLKYLRKELPPDQRVYSLENIGYQTLDLSTNGHPDFSDFSSRYYPYMASYTSRSCLFQCAFCSETYHWGRYRKKDIRQVVTQMMESYERNNLRLFFMCDCLLNPVARELSKEIIKTGITFYWDGCLRADRHVRNRNETILWRQGGFYKARIGVESGSPKVLQLMGKETTTDNVKEALASLAQAGIKTTTYWIAGHPGETEEDFQQTLTLLEELKDDIYDAECNPFRYFETGQPNSEEWAKNIKRKPMYSVNSPHLLMPQTWSLDCEPTREATIERMCRFTLLRRRLQIPNPYSIHEIQEADARWKKLHPNAVPSVLEIDSGNFAPDEARNIKKLSELQYKFQEETGDFAF